MEWILAWQISTHSRPSGDISTCLLPKILIPEKSTFHRNRWMSEEKKTRSNRETSSEK